ncbi:MAG: TetR/AcrR family transcriptional regulator [Nevskia sp.]
MKASPPKRPRAKPVAAAAAKTARRTPRGELRRDALLRAARDVFLESGFHGASIEEVVRRVGGSKASLYSYFGSKEGLFTDIIVSQCDEFMKHLDLPETADPDIAQTLAAVSRRFLRMFLDPERRELFRIIVAEAARFPEFAKRFYENGPMRARRLLGNYLRVQHEAGLIRCPDPELAASMFIEMTKATPHHRMLLGLPPYHDGHDMESHIAGAVRLFLHGVTSPPPAAPSRKSGSSR